jgi:hypothetical protein
MSRVFRRPMFRKGGGVNMNGIMSGIEDRENFQEGTGERLIKSVGERGGIDPLSQFLIQGGLRLASQPSTGGVISDIATAAQEPTADLFARLAAIEDEKRKLRLAGEEIDIASETSQKEFEREKRMREELLEKEFKFREKIEKMSGDDDDPMSIKNLTLGFLDDYQGSTVQAQNRAIYEAEGLELSMLEKFGQNNAGLIGGIHGNFTDRIKSSNIGKVFYDVTDGRVKQVTRKNGELGFKFIDLETYVPDKEKDKDTKKEKPFMGMPGYKRPPKPDVITPKIKEYMKSIEEEEGAFGTGA